MAGGIAHGSHGGPAGLAGAHLSLWRLPEGRVIAQQLGARVVHRGQGDRGEDTSMPVTLPFLSWNGALAEPSGWVRSVGLPQRVRQRFAAPVGCGRRRGEGLITRQGGEM